MINVVCVRWGTKYPPEYVNNAYRAILRNLTVPFSFHCFTEDSSGIEPAIIIHDLKHKNIGEDVAGWWHKMYLFAPDNGLTGRVFYIDLDTLIVGNIDQIVQLPHSFVVLRDLMNLENNNIGSGVMMWNAGELNHLWEDYFSNNPQQIARSYHPHGDQRYIQQHQLTRDYWQDLLPGQVVSFKLHCRNGIPDNARIVCFHGRPSIPDSIHNSTNTNGLNIPAAPWVKDYWK